MALIEGLDDTILIFLCIFLGNVVCLLYFGIVFLIRRHRHGAIRDGPDVAHPPRPHNPGMCPICRGEPLLPVETNCAHLFCGECLRTLWSQNDNWGSFPCPMCRTNVSLLFDVSTNGENLSDEESRFRENIRAFVRQYNHRQNMSGALALWDRITLLPVLLRHLIVELFNGQLSSYLVLRMVISLFFSVAYLIVQTDILPEGVFGILGLCDDLLFFVFVIFYIANLYRHFVGRQDVEER